MQSTLQLLCIPIRTMQVQSQKQDEVERVEALMREALQAKDSEIEALLDDRSRLNATLNGIKGRLATAQTPVMQAHPALHASMDTDSMR